MSKSTRLYVNDLKSKDKKRARKAARELRRRARLGRRARRGIGSHCGDLWDYYDDGLDIWECYLLLSLFEELTSYDDFDFEDYGVEYTGSAYWNELNESPTEVAEYYDEFNAVGGGELDDGAADWDSLEELPEAGPAVAENTLDVEAEASDEDVLDATSDEAAEASADESSDPTESGDGS